MSRTLVSARAAPVAGFSPSDIASLTFHGDWRDLVIVGAGYSAWGDQSAVGNDFAQATAGARPATGGAQINGHDVQAYDGSNDYMEGPAMSAFFAAAAASSYIVGRTKTLPANVDYRFDAQWLGSSNGRMGCSATQACRAWIYDGAYRFTAPAFALADNTVYAMEILNDGATLRHSCSGFVGESTGATGGGGWDSMAGLVQVATTGGGGLFGALDIAGLYTFNAVLTAGQRASMKAYLLSTHGVAPP